MSAAESPVRHPLTPLASEVRALIEQFLHTRSRLFFNEFDFQMQLCLYLREKGNFDSVDAEYYMPTRSAKGGQSSRPPILAGYEWDSNMRVDIVVRRQDEYVPVELKYTTRRVVGTLTRFGTEIADVEILRNQGAQDNLRYNCWKDVRRLELIKKVFPAVHSALAVHLTCDKAYTAEPRSTSSSYSFSTAGQRDMGGGTMDWTRRHAYAQQYPPFRLDGIYRIEWHNLAIGGMDFYYEILNI